MSNFYTGFVDPIQYSTGTNHVLRLYASVYNLAHDLVNIRGIHKWSTGSCMVLVLRSNRLSCNAKPTGHTEMGASVYLYPSEVVKY